MSNVVAKFFFCLAVLVLCGNAGAQDYPTRPVRLVVGFGAGGPTDLPARFIADKLGSLLGQRVFVENKPGAAGMIATRDVLAQPRDGYNLLLCTHFDSINTALYRSAQFKLTDLAPISLVSKYYYGLALANSIPAETLEQFLQFAKAHPGEVSYATIGAGSAQEMIARQLEKIARIEMNRIPFKSGSDVLPQVLAGRVHFYVAPTLSVLPQYRAKELKILAVTSPERLKTAPELPTTTERGIPVVAFGWLGICAASGTPQPVLDLLSRHVASIVHSAEYRAMIENAGSIAAASTPGELAQVMTNTFNEAATAAREFGMQID